MLVVHKKQDVLLRHSRVYRNLLDLVCNEEANQVGKANQNESEGKSNLQADAPRSLTKKLTHSKSVLVSNKKLLFQRRRETCEGPDGKLVQHAARTLNLMELIKDLDLKDQNISSCKEAYPFHHLFFSEDRRIRGSKKLLTHISKVKKGVEYSLRSLKEPSVKHVMEKANSLKDLPPPLKGIYFHL